jgi:hypothetical protein
MSGERVYTSSSSGERTIGWEDLPVLGERQRNRRRMWRSVAGILVLAWAAAFAGFAVWWFVQ